MPGLCENRLERQATRRALLQLRLAPPTRRPKRPAPPAETLGANTALAAGPTVSTIPLSTNIINEVGSPKLSANPCANAKLSSLTGPSVDLRGRRTKYHDTAPPNIEINADDTHAHMDTWQGEYDGS